MTRGLHDRLPSKHVCHVGPQDRAGGCVGDRHVRLRPSGVPMEAVMVGACTTAWWHCRSLQCRSLSRVTISTVTHSIKACTSSSTAGQCGLPELIGGWLHLPATAARVTRCDTPRVRRRCAPRPRSTCSCGHSRTGTSINCPRWSAGCSTDRAHPAAARRRERRVRGHRRRDPPYIRLRSMWWPRQNACASR